MKDRRPGAELPPLSGFALFILRSARRWRQSELADAAGIRNTVVSRYETGATPLPRARLAALAAVMGYDEGDVDWVILALEGIYPEGESASPLAPTAAEHRAMRRAASAGARAVYRLILRGLERRVRGARTRQQRREAVERRAWLKQFSLADQRLVVEVAAELQTWALCELLCEETIRATPKDPRAAMDLADLARSVGARVPGGERWRAQVESYAWAHLANARRVANDHLGAEEAFAAYHKLRAAGPPAEAGLLDEGRPLDLEASLRRDQRRFAEALALHDRALDLSRPQWAVYVLLNKSFTLEQAGSHERAVETLREAARRLGEPGDPRLLFGLRFNLAVNLCHLDRYREAEALVPELREIAVRLGNAIDVVRGLWLSGRVAAGLGRREEALAALEQVRRDFMDLALPYDMALASLDLAALYLEDGRTAEVQQVTGQMVAIFMAKNVHREALIAIELFHRAAQAETATADLARRLARYLERARHDPALRFEA